MMIIYNCQTGAVFEQVQRCFSRIADGLSIYMQGFASVFSLRKQIKNQAGTFHRPECNINPPSWILNILILLLPSVQLAANFARSEVQLNK